MSDVATTAASSSMFNAFSIQTSLMIIGAILVILYIWLLLNNTEMALQIGHMLIKGLIVIITGIGTVLFLVVKSIAGLFSRGRR